MDKTLAIFSSQTPKVSGPTKDFGYKVTFEMGEQHAAEAAKLLMIGPEKLLKITVEVE